MTYKEFWEGDNDLPKFYRKKHEYDLQHMNEMAYLQGVYVAKAISMFIKWRVQISRET